ncbi:MAG: cation:proton antiporter [Cyanobacteria bacterium]|nr:cation:proton antiporter [Cyanobacteriota bacterium]
MLLSPLVTALLAVVLIISLAQLLGQLADRLGQPRVLGDIVSGILLGPSLLGALQPQFSAWMFSPAVCSQLNLLGQLGLVLFMFLVGLELNPKLLQGRIPLASRITTVGVLLPLGLGLVLANRFEAWQPELLPGNYALAGALFMGTAMAITAFPVLARILAERNLLGQPLGALAITAAAIDDVVGWTLLAAVVAFSHSGSAIGAVPTLLAAVLYVVVLLWASAPLRRWMERRQRRGHMPGPTGQTLVFVGALLSGVATELIGVHLIFGAFLWGLAMPRNEAIQSWLALRLETVVLRLLLPLFFAMSGLNTRIGSLNSVQLWLAAGLLLLVAVAGKFLGTWAVARASGLPQREAQALGWLMNTRGLTELVVLNVGLSLGVISTELFTMGVLMALITTAMAGPLLARLGYKRLASP